MGAGEYHLYVHAFKRQVWTTPDAQIQACEQQRDCSQIRKKAARTGSGTPIRPPSPHQHAQPREGQRPSWEPLPLLDAACKSELTRSPCAGMESTGLCLGSRPLLGTTLAPSGLSGVPAMGLGVATTKGLEKFQPRKTGRVRTMPQLPRGWDRRSKAGGAALPSTCRRKLC